jgi:hypothetical protein
MDFKPAVTSHIELPILSFLHCSGNLLDTLCARLERLMEYEPGERDLVMLQHKFVVDWADGSEVRWFYFLFTTRHSKSSPLRSQPTTTLPATLPWP